MVISTL